jgi:hypothetical protein
MHKDSPHYHFSHDHLPYLHRLKARGETPTKADLKRILENDPDARTDPWMTRLLQDDAAGTLKRKRGRKKLDLHRRHQIFLLSILVPLRAEQICQIRAANANGRTLCDLSPTQQAAEDYARDWKLGSGLSLLNQISAHRNIR